VIEVVDWTAHFVGPRGWETIGLEVSRDTREIDEPGAFAIEPAALDLVLQDLVELQSDLPRRQALSFKEREEATLGSTVAKHRSSLRAPLRRVC
jgi:hypothetical protein